MVNFFRHYSYIFIILILACMSVALGVDYASSSRDLARINAEKQELAASLQLLNLQIEDYNALLSEENEDALVEKAAREKLDYIYPGEEVYIDISGK